MFCGGIGVFLYQLAGLHHSFDVTSSRIKLTVDAVAVLRVGAAAGSVDSPRGLLSWDWRLHQGSMYANVTVPYGFTAANLEMPLLDGQSRLLEGTDTLWELGSDHQMPTVGVRRVTKIQRPQGSTLSVEMSAGSFSFVLQRAF